MSRRSLVLVLALAACSSAPKPVPTAAPQKTPLGELDAAHAAENAGDLAGAREHLEAAVALSPTLGLAQVDLADVLLHLGEEGPELAKAVEAATRLEPQNPRAWRIAGAFAEDQGDSAKAMDAYQRAVALRPADSRSQFRLAGLYAAANRPGDAIAAYRAVLSLEPNERGARLALAQLLIQQHALDQAEAELRTLTAADPGNALYQSRLQEVLVLEGKVEPTSRKRVMRPLRKSRR